MKVLIVHPQMALYAGAEIVVVRLAHYLQEHGHEVSVLTLSTSAHPDYKGLHFILPEKESDYIQYRLRGSLGALRDIFQMYWALRKLCAKHADKYDVINVHNFPSIWAVPTKPIVWMCNEVPELWHNEDMSGVLNQALNTGRVVDRVIARSKSPTAVVPDEKCAQRFQHRYGIVPEIIPYGIEGTFFSQEVNVERSNKFCVIHPAMLSPSKNQMAVLESLLGLDIRVIFAGYSETSHPYVKRLKAFVVDEVINATFTGQVSREELRVLYHIAHVAVFPGKGQGSWLGPFEAISTGCPVIVAPNISCSSVIQKEDLGIVTADLRGAIMEVYRNYSEYREKALKGREFVLNNLTWDNFGTKMMELLER